MIVYVLVVATMKSGGIEGQILEYIERVVDFYWRISKNIGKVTYIYLAHCMHVEQIEQSI